MAGHDSLSLSMSMGIYILIPHSVTSTAAATAAADHGAHPSPADAVGSPQERMKSDSHPLVGYVRSRLPESTFIS